MKTGKLIDWALAAGLFAMAGALVFFGLRLERARQPAAPQPPLVLGATLPPLSAEALDGSPVKVGLGADRRPTIVYVFSPACVWCKRNLKNLKAVMRAGRQRFHWVGLSTSPVGLGGYIKTSGMNFDQVLERPAPDSIAAWRIGATPETFVLAPGGKLLAHWRGAWAGAATRAAVEKYFSVVLPPWVVAQ